MQLRRVRAEESAVERFVAEGWEPYHADLAAVVPAHALDADADRGAVVSHYRDLLDSPEHGVWVALEGASDPAASLSSTDGTVAGFVRTRLATAPWMFDWPDRLAIEAVWVREAHRGSGLAGELVDRAVRQAREDGCAELTLDVALANERAGAFAESLGFERQSLRMDVALADLALGTDDGPLAGDSGQRLRRVRAAEDAMHRFVEECWLPFWRDLGAAVGEDHLVGDLDRDRLVAELVDDYDVADRRCWVLLEDAADPGAPLGSVDGAFTGWLNAGLEPTDRFLDPPERLFVGNLYVAPDYRGTGLADRLVARARQYAREEGCGQLTLGVEVANERALAYYEKLGFEPRGRRLAAPVDEIAR